MSFNHPLETHGAMNPKDVSFPTFSKVVQIKLLSLAELLSTGMPQDGGKRLTGKNKQTSNTQMGLEMHISA